MCTLIIARDVLGPDTVLLGANRDERPARPSIPPGVLVEHPRVVGGRDQVAGGTWLALRDDGAAVALLNRRDPWFHDPPKNRRSRGLLTLEVAQRVAPPPRAGTGADPSSRAALDLAMQSLGGATYAPFSLVYASPFACWIMVHDGTTPRIEPIPRGWHVLTHMELDDPAEPRAAHLLGRLRDQRPVSLTAAEALVTGLLRSHGEDGSPPVCLHTGTMATVSSSLVWIGPSERRYLHAEGRPCEHEFRDVTSLIAPAEQPGERP